MTQNLGKIEKPEAESFKGERKLYFIPLLLAGREAPPDFQQLVEKYWKEIDSQVTNLETKLGRADRIYHELVSGKVEEALIVVQEISAVSYSIIKARLDKGASFEAVEETELLTEFTDWGKCLSSGLQSQNVFDQVYKSYNEALKKRNVHIAERIENTLKDGETGILLMREGHQVQFPADIQVFYVSPPSLDEIKRWFRNREDKNSQVPGAES